MAYLHDKNISQCHLDCKLQLKGAGLSIILFEAGVLLAFALVLIVVANIKLKKRLV